LKKGGITFWKNREGGFMRPSKVQKKNTGDGLAHEADSLRMLPSGPDLVQIAHSTRSPVNKTFYYI